MLLEKVLKHALREGDSGAIVVELQNALRLTGAELIVDGDFGSITKAAVKRFQASVVPTIAVDGFVGPITARYLDAVVNSTTVDELVKAAKPEKSVLAIAPWLSRARAQTGIREIPGARSNPVILQWVAELGAKYPILRRNIDWFRNDDIPWCGLFAAQALGLCDPGFMPDEAPLLVSNWHDWGITLKVPVVGVVGCFKRPGGGHIGFIESEEKDFYHLRGGNQSNSVNVSKIAKSRLVVLKWPLNYPVPSASVGILPRRTMAQAASVNER